MKSYFLLNKDWGFTQAIEEINKRYRPGGISSGLARNVQIENWGVLVGRTRALAEINLAIEEEGSKTKLCKKIQISNSSMNDIIAFFKGLPDDSNKKEIQQGKVLSGYFLLSLYGKGGNAVVWKVRTNDKKTHIMKIARRARGISLSRFNDEIEILKKINNLQNPLIQVIPLIDSYTNLDGDGFPWFTMPEAIPLEKYIADKRPTPLTILKGMLEVCRTLEILHKENIFHRDIKPDNILIYKGRWYLGDFGIATFPNKQEITREGCKLGSLHFYAPEMLSTKSATSGEHADIFSFAKTLWVLLSGQKYPLAGEMRLDRAEALVSTYCQINKIEFIDEVISHCTSFTPSQRPNISSVKQCIEKVLTD